MIELLSYPFLQHALAAGILSSIACGIIGTYIVIKRISFISGSISHSAFGGIGIGYFLGYNPLGWAIGFAACAALLIGTIRKKFQQEEDTLIGAVWAVGMAIGILFISLSKGYAADLLSYLFGNILLLSKTDLATIIILDIVILISVVILYRPLQAITFDEEYSTVINLPVFTLYQFLLVLIAFTTVILIKMVGIILVITLLTLPAAAAKNLATSLKSVMTISILLCLAATTIGIMLAAYFNLPTGPTIIALSVILYGISLVKH